MEVRWLLALSQCPHADDWGIRTALVAWTWNRVDTVGRRYETEMVMPGPCGGNQGRGRRGDLPGASRSSWTWAQSLKTIKSVLITAAQPSSALQRVEGHTDSWHREWGGSREAQRRAHKAGA